MATRCRIHSVGEALGSAFLHVTGMGPASRNVEADEAQLDALDGTLLTGPRP